MIHGPSATNPRGWIRIAAIKNHPKGQLRHARCLRRQQGDRDLFERQQEQRPDDRADQRPQPTNNRNHRQSD